MHRIISHVFIRLGFACFTFPAHKCCEGYGGSGTVFAFLTGSVYFRRLRCYGAFRQVDNWAAFVYNFPVSPYFRTRLLLFICFSGGRSILIPDWSEKVCFYFYFYFLFSPPIFPANQPTSQPLTSSRTDHHHHFFSLDTQTDQSKAVHAGRGRIERNGARAIGR
jgi:hypothetical protein